MQDIKETNESLRKSYKLLRLQTFTKHIHPEMDIFEAAMSQNWRTILKKCSVDL